ncbi:hypothetical protein JCM10207_008201 [Rhodosporidiobolus poonsookiae]
MATSRDDQSRAKLLDGEGGEWADMPTLSPSPSSNLDGRSLLRRVSLAASLLLGTLLAYILLFHRIDLLSPSSPVNAVEEALLNLSSGGGKPLSASESAPVASVASSSSAKTASALPLNHIRRFLVPQFVNEQESRGQIHLIQLAALATHLNRTLVLPNMRLSYFDECGDAPFDFFYEPTAFANETSSSPVLQRDFTAWLGAQPGPISALALSITIPEPEKPAAPSFNEFLPNTQLRPSCIDLTKLNTTARRPLVYYTPQSAAADHIPDELRALDAADPVDVLLLEYDLRAMLFPDAMRSGIPGGFLERAFSYQAEWHALAQTTLGVLGGGAVAGVHWRTETVDVDALQPCGSSLVQALVRVKQDNADVQSVYLATDFAIEALEGSPARRSGAWNANVSTAQALPPAETDGSYHLAHSDSYWITPAHLTAISSFLSTFSASAAAPPTNLTLHTFASLLPALLSSAPSRAQWLTHPAASRIVDLLVLERADVFLAGWNRSTRPVGGVCARLSNWTARIERVRTARVREQERAKGGKVAAPAEGGRRPLRNTVGRWSREGAVQGLRGR